MSQQIGAYIDTSHVEGDNYLTTLDWTAPPTEDTEAFMRAATKQFGKQLRRAIQVHHE